MIYLRVHGYMAGTTSPHVRHVGRLARTPRRTFVIAQTLGLKIAEKPYIIGSLGPKALKYESFDAKGKG